MDRLKKLYEQYLKANSSISFFKWLEGERENYDNLMKETNCVSMHQLRGLCSSMSNFTNIQNT